MKTNTTILYMAIFSIFVLSAGLMSADESVIAETEEEMCTIIQDQVLNYSEGHYLAGEPLTTGYDPYGYNYQANMFKGSYANAYLGSDGFPPYEGDDDAYYERLVDEGYNDSAEKAKGELENLWYWDSRDTELIMKWNDAWLSNKDCEGDGLLDRHYGYDSYIGSGAWVTNHMRGGEGKDKWTYFTKIVAVPEEAYRPWNITGNWVVNANGNLHNMIITEQNADGSFEGYGNYQNGPQTWTIENGKVDGNSIEMNWTYQNSDYEAYFEGTLDSVGEISGTFDDTSGHEDLSWSTINGKATQSDYWYTADGSEIGHVIWGQFAQIQTVESGEGATYVSPTSAGLGYY